MLYTWGTLQFLVHPLNANEVEHTTNSEYARKDVPGTLPPREFVGEGDELILMRGKVFPLAIGGLTELEVLDLMRKHGIAAPLARGDGAKLGWFVLETLHRIHKSLAPQGFGREIEFEALFTRVPVPNPAGWIADLLRIIG